MKFEGSHTVFGTLVDILLQHPVDGGEEDTETRHADYQIPVLVRMPLSISQDGGVDEVKLHVLSSMILASTRRRQGGGGPRACTGRRDTRPPSPA